MALRIAPKIDLVLLSHGDLAHSGLYPYAYSRWGLKAPAYSTLPVQAMARIAASEEVDGLRDEQDVDGSAEAKMRDEEDKDAQEAMDVREDGPSEGERGSPAAENTTGKYVATPQEVHDAFDSINTLRYSQPTHLQGTSLAPSSRACRHPFLFS